MEICGSTYQGVHCTQPLRHSGRHIATGIRGKTLNSWRNLEDEQTNLIRERRNEMTQSKKTYTPGPRTISLSAILKSGDPNCGAFQKRLTKVLYDTGEENKYWVTFDSLLAYFKDDPRALDWLVQQKFFAVVEPPDRSFSLMIVENENNFVIQAIDSHGEMISAGNILQIRKDGSGIARHTALNQDYFEHDSDRRIKLIA